MQDLNLLPIKTFGMKSAGFLLLTCILLAACKKDGNNAVPGTAKFGYRDSIFYLKTTDYTISPIVARTGKYTALPADLNLDEKSGAITVGVKGKDGVNSQTGLRYRVVFTAPDGSSDTTHIVLAGINYQDKIYYLSQNEKQVIPLYNASGTTPSPGGIFSSPEKKLAIDPATGKIDLEKTVANSLFHNDPRDNDWEVVTINYKTNDQGSSRMNSIDVVLYYYSETKNIPSNISAVMRAHQDQLLGIAPTSIPVTTAPEDREIVDIVSFAKPRPPCIIIIGR